MLRNTFLHIPGIGNKTEQRFWAENVLSWESFLNRSKVPGLSKNTISKIDEWLSASKSALERGDIHFFGDKLHPCMLATIIWQENLKLWETMRKGI